MSTEEKPKSNAKIFGVIILIIMIGFQLVRITSKMQTNARNKSFSEEIKREEQAEDSLYAATGIKSYKGGQLFMSPDGSFMIPIMVDLNTVPSIFNDEILFVGTSKTNKEDQAGLSVVKVLFDSTVSLVENWKRRSSEASWEVVKSDPKSDGGSIFEIKSKDGQKSGIVRLERSKGFLFIIKGQSLTKDWRVYQGAFSFCVRGFRFGEKRANADR
jgi:hypothetical protein